MHVARLGLTPIKGGAHTTHSELEVDAHGPVGDRVFALIDLGRRRVLRTVETSALIRARSRWADGVLTVDLDGEQHRGAPEPRGEPVDVDYWGRTVGVRLQSGPWAAAFSRALGAEVALARTERRGGFVYGAGVSLITTAELRTLAERIGAPVAAERFRCTAVIDTEQEEEAWIGGELQLGSARVRVTAPLIRCAVIDIDPSGGSERSRLLRELARYRLGPDGIRFGVQAEVIEPGRIRTGDPVQSTMPSS
ncbi:MOSC domain-containing protein [Microbacteriaceae bacterium VKM Ac-2854]|nr:MOSC domain-containing protein [Microbacteriaceae bacterium VKM Ac-2854]